MNKLFWILLIACFIGALGLWFMIQKNQPESTPHSLEDAEYSKEKDEVMDVGHEETDLVEKVEQNEAAPVETQPEAEDQAKQTEELDGPSLNIVSIPPSADVYVEGVFSGKTPMSLPLASRQKKVKIQLEAYEDYEDLAPSVAESEGSQINWRVKLKPKVASNSKAVERLVGTHGPYFVQLKAVAYAQWENNGVPGGLTNVPQLRACKVDLRDKGLWVRFLMGPYPTEVAANEEIKTRMTLPGDAFVTGEQRCLP